MSVSANRRQLQLKVNLQLRFKMPKYNNLETINLKFKISVSQAEIHVTYLPNSLS